MSLSARILSIDNDDLLRLSRELILRKEGYAVESVTCRSALELLPNERFQIAVIGDSVNASRSLRIAAALKQADPGIRILRVGQLSSPAGDSYDMICETLSSPGVFLEALKNLSRRAAA